MKRSTYHAMFAVAGGTAVLVAALFMSAHGAPTGEPDTTKKPEALAASARAHLTPAPARIAQRAVMHQAADESIARKPAPEPSEEIDYEAPSIVHTVAKTDPALYEIAYYRHHVLLSAAGRAEYHELLSDPWMLEKARSDILYPEETKENIVGNTKRLMEIDFLRDALAWEENPKHDDILDMIEQMILSDNFQKKFNTSMRLSLAGNKTELFELLKTYDAARAESLIEKARGTRLEALVAFIRDEVAGRQAREAANVIIP